MKQPVVNIIRDIKSDYYNNKFIDEITGEWGSFILYRWPSFILSGLLLRMSVTANAVTLLSIVTIFLLPIVCFLDSRTAYLYLFSIGFIIGVLDCTDGNIARMTMTTRLGQYLDFIADILYRILMYAAFGYTLQYIEHTQDFIGRNALLVCIVAALFSVVARLCRVYSEKRFMVEKAAAGNPDTGAMADSKLNYLVSFISGIDPLLPVFILIVYIFNVTHWLAIWLIFYSLLDFLHTQAGIINNLK